MKKRFTCHDIAEMYGVHVQTVWSWVRKGQLGAVRIGGTYYIRQTDIDEMENRLAVGPSAKPAEAAV